MASEVTPRPRAKRPRTVGPDVASLVEKWTPLAALRDPGYTWDGALYAKPTRETGPDRVSLSMHKGALKLLLAECPTGFPSQVRLRDVLMELHQRHHILGCADRFVYKCANESADIWRVMCRDLYEMKKKQKKDSAPRENQDVQELIDMIDTSDQEATWGTSLSSASLDAAASASVHVDAVEQATGVPKTADAVEQATGVPKTAEEVERAFQMSWRQNSDHDEGIHISDASGDDDVIMVAAVCRCLECRRHRAVPVPSAARSGQRRETQVRRRLRSKQMAPLEPAPKHTKKPKLKAKLKANKLKGKTGKMQLCPNDAIEFPTSVVHRQKLSRGKQQEAYVMGGGKYVAGLSVTASREYLAHVEQLKMLIDEKKITTRSEADECLTFLAGMGQ